jgi:hypothetical protein
MAIDASRFVYAIRQTESGGNPLAIGDDGRAWTSIQCHPPWLWQWASALNVPPRLGESWDAWAIRVLWAFAWHHRAWDPVALAMYFHVGHACQPSDLDWSDDYAARFTRNWASYPDARNQNGDPA